MPAFTVYVRDRLEISFLGEGVKNALKKACEVHIPSTPDSLGQSIFLWEKGEGSKLFLPRGILPFMQVLDLNVIDERFTWEYSWSTPSRVTMRPHQEDQVRAIMEGEQGIIVAPPSSGKTITVLEASRRLRQRTLIIVDRINVARQWQEAWNMMTGGTSVIYGDGVSVKGLKGVPSTVSEDTHISIVLQQSLNKLTDQEIRDLCFGFVCLDECHHVSASSYIKTVGNMRAKHRIGVSATPTRNDGLELVSQLILGPVLHRITSDSLEHSKFLMKPSIRRVETRFNHPFWSTGKVMAEQKCPVPRCKKQGTNHYHKNNYGNVIAKLVEDDYRNGEIVREIVSYRDNTNLVVSDRLEHLDRLYHLCASESLLDPERLYMLTGRETSKERDEVYRLAGYGSCVIFSTIAKEALNIPRLDRLHLAWPIKKEHLLEQQIGRITRAHPDKRDAIVIDYVDECPVLKTQSFSRLRYYQSKKYDIKGF